MKKLRADPAGKPSQAQRAANAKPKARRRGVVGTILYFGVLANIWGSLVLAAVVGFYAYDLPDIDQALTATRRPTVSLLAADGEEIAVFGDLYGASLDLRQLPPALPAAVLSIEDRRFYDHFGLDPIGLLRAARKNIQARRIVEGGSTITQQVAKNLFLNNERTIRRKVQEVLLALWLEQKLSKDQILTVYLNRVYLGAGAYGADAAARRFFNKPAEDLTLYESALIAGLLKAPSRLNPLNDPAAAAQRADVVLAAMVDVGSIFSADRALALKEQARALAAPREARVGRHFAAWVFDELPDFARAGGRDLVVRTTLDLGLQRAAERIVASALERDGDAAGASEAAVVVLSPDGDIKAMVGGQDFSESQFNRATQAQRQPGSAFKPLVYLAALENGFTPESRMQDGPITVEGWRPRNFERNFRGTIDLGESLTHSVNTVAVQLAERVGRQKVITVARALGIASPMTLTPSLALGTSLVTPLELTTAYAALANGGLGVFARGIDRVETRTGDVLYQRTGAGTGRVAEEGAVGALSLMLRRVIEEGTGRAAQLDRPAAGKTGTSQDFRDAWFVGYTADFVCGVWVGNDDDRPMKNMTGGRLPAAIWREIMMAAHRG
ncbi:MAG: PBP1A family penicillin-binding protein, partial [Proteobacteria bacterium]|nr:PBP1A family penicillin-binding protein [Pseudomonadota bacterium]